MKIEQRQMKVEAEKPVRRPLQQSKPELIVAGTRVHSSNGGGNDWENYKFILKVELISLTLIFSNPHVKG